MKLYPLPKDFATNWIKALRSGQFEQAYGQLFRPTTNCYCSMGVAYAANEVPFNAAGDNVAEGYTDIIMETFPIDKNSGSLWYRIYVLNDEKKKTFLEIADWIETNVEFI